MASDTPLDIASLLQSASVKRNPSPAHDLNPSTAASEKLPVRFSRNADPGAASDIDEDEIPVNLLDPVPRRTTMPPLPDMRFEQSYLKSIEKAESWQGVLWITLRDQVRIGALTVDQSLTGPGYYVLRPRRTVELAAPRLALLQPVIQVQWSQCRCSVEAVVVGSQQVVNTDRGQRPASSQERSAGECCFPKCPIAKALPICGIVH
jgi:hypothetical protein